jgi:uncharacterized protein YjdB
MRKNLIILFFFMLNSSLSFTQVILTIEGTIINSSVSGSWSGVNIPRDVPTIFTYRNNSITSINTQGYMLQAGDESPGPTNNKLDGEVITGNKFSWNGANSPSVITHALFAGYNINSVVKYNYLDNAPYGIIFKSGTDAGVNMTFTAGGCAYNICRNGKFAGRVKGINGVRFYNNTFYSGDGKGWYLLLITGNMDRQVSSPSTGTKVFNNIFYSTIQIPMIKMESGCLTGFECDYNIYWCSAGEPTFNIDGVTVTWSQWRARGLDVHSRIMNPNFQNTIDFVPANRLDYGTSLGTEWQAGLSTNAIWNVGTSPATTDQNGTWQVGARVYGAQTIYVSGISVTGTGGANTISSDNGSLLLSASVLPVNATNQAVTWSVINGTGEATISSSGLLTAIANGTVTAIATANDGSGVHGSLVVTISNQLVPISSILVTGAGGASLITSPAGTLQLYATVMPANASVKTISWSITNVTGQATISSTGLVTALAEGTVTARATATDGTGIYGELPITISSQIIPVTSIAVTGSGGATTISTDNGSLQLQATVLPANATDGTVVWSVINGTGGATINPGGLLTAVANGTVTARATANDGTGVYGTLVISISNQIVQISSITVTAEGGATAIYHDKGTLQLLATLLPSYATNQVLNWSVANLTGEASIDASGLLTAIADGIVTVKAAATDGSGVYGTLNITISGQIIYVTDITVTGEGGATSINHVNSSLQLNAAVIPADATDKSVLWSLSSGAGAATITSDGLVTALENGIVTAMASSNDGSGVFGTLDITIDLTNPKPYNVVVTSGEIRITFYDDFLTGFTDLYNLLGMHLMKRTIDSDFIVLNTAGISTGLYLLVISKGEFLSVEKVMIL